MCNIPWKQARILEPPKTCQLLKLLQLYAVIAKPYQYFNRLLKNRQNVHDNL